MANLDWYTFNRGATLGTEGSERGVIVTDEEHALGARLTLERGTQTAPFAITCGVYGWLVHTRFFPSETEANAEYDSDENCAGRTPRRGTPRRGRRGSVHSY